MRPGRDVSAGPPRIPARLARRTVPRHDVRERRNRPWEDAMSIWASGALYERYVGRWSRPVAHELLSWLGVPGGARWLDVGCGTGALSETILREAAHAQVVGIDQSEGYVGHAREQVRDPRASFQV